MLWRAGFWLLVALLNALGVTLGPEIHALLEKLIGASPIPFELLGGIATAILTVGGAAGAAWKLIKKAQHEKAITEIIPPGPDGRKLEAEFLHVYLNDLGVPTMSAAKDKALFRLADLKAKQAAGWDVSPEAWVAFVRKHKREPKYGVDATGARGFVF